MFKAKVTAIAALVALIVISKLPVTALSLGASFILVVIFAIAGIPVVRESLENLDFSKPPAD